MKIEKGMQVPKFSLKSLAGQTVTNESMLGKKYMISFYRYASCPFCNLRVSFLMDLHKSLGLNHQMLAVFQSSEEDMKAHVGKQTPVFPLFSDEGMKYYKAFGVEQSWMAYIKGALNISTLINAYKQGFKIGRGMGPRSTVPADFLVDERGLVIYAYYGHDISDHLDIEIVEQFYSAH